MSTEIERKFLVKSFVFKNKAFKTDKIIQGYITTDADKCIRVRITEYSAFLTIKGRTDNITRIETEVEIDRDKAREMLLFCEGKVIEKTRYHVMEFGKIFEVDVFEGQNTGLVIAEIELKDENEHFIIPEWIGEEVSSDPGYFNMQLALNPYCNWNKEKNRPVPVSL